MINEIDTNSLPENPDPDAWVNQAMVEEDIGTAEVKPNRFFQKTRWDKGTAEEKEKSKQVMKQIEEAEKNDWAIFLEGITKTQDEIEENDYDMYHLLSFLLTINDCLKQ